MADTNVDNYTIDELFAILGLNASDNDEQEIIDATEIYINKYTDEHSINSDSMISFFQDTQAKLIDYMQALADGKDPLNYAPDNTQTQEWLDNEVLTQADPVQVDKITDRAQKIDVYDNAHHPMKREQLGVTNTIDTKVAQDKLNPNLENVTNRVIVLDSQYRQMDGGVSASSTDYTLDLSEKLSNVISLRLYSIQIPFNWYTIDTIFGNTCLWITNYSATDLSSTTFLIQIDSGNYSPSDLQSALNIAFASNINPNTGKIYPSGHGFVPPSVTNPPTVPVTYNAVNGKITISLDGFTDPNGDTINAIQPGDIANNTAAYITFFDFTRELQCKENCSSPGLYFDRSLGWIMGFRLPNSPIIVGGNTGTAIVNLFGSKYFILILDDYNQNHINNGVINIAELSTRLSMPSYYTPDMPYTCISNVNNVMDFQNNLTEQQAAQLGININNVSGIILDNTYLNNKSTPTILPSAPRTLTQAQIYTINEIIKAREKTVSFRGKPPSSSDALAIIPLKVGGLKLGEMYIEFGGTLQDNKRIYFGPVNIDRMHIKLLDDKGYPVNLNGGDWAVTLISENLYQY